MRTLIPRFLLIAIFTSLFLAQISCSSSDDPKPKPPSEQKPIVLEEKPAINGKAQVISDGSESSGLQSAAEILSTTAGDAMAIWKTETGNGVQLRYSFKLANSDVWPEAKSLLSVSYIESIFDRIELPESGFFSTNGSQFVLVWSQDEKVFVTHYDPAVSPEWSVATLLNPGGAPRSFIDTQSVKIASNGSGFMAVWLQQDSLYSNFYENNSWQTSALLVEDADTLYPINRDTLRPINYRIRRGPVLTSSGKNYGVMLAINSVINNLDQGIVSAYEFNVGVPTPAWGSRQILTSKAMIGDIMNLKLTATKRGFLGAWLQSDEPRVFNFRLYAKEFSISGNPPISMPAQLVSGADGTLTNPNYSLAQNVDGYAFAWGERANTTNFNSAVKVNLYQSGTTPAWSGPVEITAIKAFEVEPTIVNFNNAYAVQWRQSTQILTKTITATDFAQASVVIVDSFNRFQAIFLQQHQSRLLTSWQETDANGTRSIYTRESADGINWDAAILLQQYTGDARSIAISSSIRLPLFSFAAYNSDLILSWSATIKENNKISSKLFTSVYSSGWQAIQTFANNTARASGLFPKMVSNEAGQTLAVWYQLDGKSYQLLASIRTAGTWSTPVIIEGSRYFSNRFLIESSREDFQVASNGRKFALTWNAVGSVYAQLYDGTSWQAEATLLSDDFSFSRGSVIVPQQDLFQVFWVEDPNANTTNFMISITVDNQWKNSLLFAWEDQSTAPYYVSKLRVAPNVTTNGYALAWLQTNTDNTDTIFTRVNEQGEWLTPVTKINDIPEKVRSLAVSSANSDRYALAWEVSGATERGAYVSLFDATQVATWLAPELVLENGNKLALSSNDRTFALVAGTGNRLLARVYDSDSKLWGSISEFTPVDTHTYIDYVSLVSNNNEFIAIWNDNLSRNGNIGIAKYSNGTWLSSELPLAPDSGEIYIQAPVISAYRDEYALSWGQVNLQSDASITQVMGLLGGF